MGNRKELEEKIQIEYRNNKMFLEEQFKKVTDNNVLTVLLENINTIEGDDSFTELDLLETIMGTVNIYGDTDVVELFYHIKNSHSDWNLYNKEEKLRGLEYGTN